LIGRRAYLSSSLLPGSGFIALFVRRSTPPTSAVLANLKATWHHVHTVPQSAARLSGIFSRTPSRTPNQLAKVPHSHAGFANHVSMVTIHLIANTSQAERVYRRRRLPVLSVNFSGCTETLGWGGNSMWIVWSALFLFWDSLCPQHRTPAAQSPFLQNPRLCMWCSQTPPNTTT
jgi:hypothetical protein